MLIHVSFVMKAGQTVKLLSSICEKLPTSNKSAAITNHAVSSTEFCQAIFDETMTWKQLWNQRLIGPLLALYWIVYDEN